LLTGKILPGHKFAEGDHRPTTVFYQEENIQRINRFLDQIRPLAIEKKATVSQLVLRWTIQQPGITVALAGARNAQQAIENARSTEIHLSAEESGRISQLLGDVHLVK
jgi:aryl-alcohol dehydrogenase-like predicted oxidoreductase